MSAQHTPERLVLTTQDDTPTGCASFESKQGLDVVVLYHENAKADARRLVACWNACHGVPTEVLEKQTAGGLPWRVADQIDMLAQRDELLAELMVARSALADFTGLSEPHAHSLARRFAEGIAKVKGGAA